MITKSMTNFVLVGDIGGTKTLLGIFDTSTPRPSPIATRSFATLEYRDLPSIVDEFLTHLEAKPTPIETACFGVAGPVIDEAAELTNVPWRIEARRIAAAFGIARVKLLNDLESIGYSVPVLRSDELHVLQQGTPRAGGNMALIAAGTGLGEALIHNVGGRLIPSASEGGHADFAARTEREIALVRDITSRFGRCDVEHVISGRGLLNIYRVAHRSARCTVGIDVNDAEAAAHISSAAIERRCAGCVETLDIFVDAYGAEAGNLALRSVSTGGLFVGGGIAPKILPALTAGGFMRAFLAKAPLELMVASMPVQVVLNAEAGLLGAAVYAAHFGPASTT
jgi:glucokinase